MTLLWIVPAILGVGLFAIGIMIVFYLHQIVLQVARFRGALTRLFEKERGKPKERQW